MADVTETINDAVGIDLSDRTTQVVIAAAVLGGGLLISRLRQPAAPAEPTEPAPIEVMVPGGWATRADAPNTPAAFGWVGYGDVVQPPVEQPPDDTTGMVLRVDPPTVQKGGRINVTVTGLTMNESVDLYFDNTLGAPLATLVVNASGSATGSITVPAMYPGNSVYVVAKSRRSGITRNATVELVEAQAPATPPPPTPPAPRPPTPPAPPPPAPPAPRPPAPAPPAPRPPTPTTPTPGYTVSPPISRPPRPGTPYPPTPAPGYSITFPTTPPTTVTTPYPPTPSAPPPRTPAPTPPPTGSTRPPRQPEPEPRSRGGDAGGPYVPGLMATGGFGANPIPIVTSTHARIRAGESLRDFSRRIYGTDSGVAVLGMLNPDLVEADDVVEGTTFRVK